MFKNVFYNTRESMIHLWEQINGENLYTDIHWSPYLYENSDHGTVKTLDDKKARRITFNNYGSYYQYQQESNNALENNVRPEIQFLAERYYDIKDDEISTPKIKVYYLDIEVQSDSQKFPDVSEANDSITLLSVYDNTTNSTISFGIDSYTGKYSKEKWMSYVQCESDRDLLKRFFEWIHDNPPDVITGWNVINFDLLYIRNRTKNLFGEKNSWFDMLSPINIVRTWESKSSKNTNIDIAGITILDYLDLYKWYSPKKLERHTLDYVCKYELEKGKVDYSEYKDLSDLYHSDYNLYVEYNVIDCYRIFQLEDKLGYINLVQSLSLLTKAPMKYYNGMTNLIEGMLITYYRRNNMCAPRLYGGTQESYEAAYVKNPIIGKHEWVVDLDITSSYPHQIITLNMSPETYYGRIRGFTEDKIIQCVKDKSFPPFDMMTNNGLVHFDENKLEVFHKVLSKRMVAISPCGSVFVTKPLGVIPAMEKYVFSKRAEVRSRIRSMKKALPELRNSDLEKSEEKIKQFNSLQLALKVILNAVYGILAVPYSRYFNTNIAEAVCSCGRLSVKTGEKFTNKILNSPSSDLISIIDKFGEYKPSGKGIDYILAMDTDSLFINLGLFLDNNIGKDWRKQSDDDIKVMIRNISGVIESYVNDLTYREVQRKIFNSNEEEFRISFKQEMIAKSALFVAKKKYAVWVVSEDSSPVDEIKTTGLEIIRSDTPEIIRPMLSEILQMILKGYEEDKIENKISEFKKNLTNTSPIEIAVNIGVHNIDKYINSDDKTIKGSPWHVKGVANYRSLLKKLKIEKKYAEISNNSKLKVVYVKKNQYNIESVSFTEWPKEFDKILQIDYEKMISNFFISKIKMLLDPMNKSSILSGDTKSSVSLFF